MLTRIYAPTDLGLPDSAPESLEQKLAHIKSEPIAIQETANDTGIYHAGSSLIYGATFALRAATGRATDTLHLSYLSIDESLYGNGVGTLVMKAVVAYTLRVEPAVQRLTGKEMRLGGAKTVARVVGDQNLTITKGDSSYGRGTDRPFKEILDDYPLVEGKPYVIDTISALIMPSVADGWGVRITTHPDKTLVSLGSPFGS